MAFIARRQVSSTTASGMNMGEGDDRGGPGGLGQGNCALGDPVGVGFFSFYFSFFYVLDYFSILFCLTKI